MSSLCRFALLAVGLALVMGCQDKKQAPPPEPVPVQVRDSSGVLVAELKALRPCRGSIGPVELIVGGPPLLATLGDTKWTGSTATNGTTLSRNGEAVARVFPVGDAASAAVIDMQGVALARIVVTGQAATVSDAASVPVRNLKSNGTSITSDELKLTITGTQDLILAALLSAPELMPEVRIIAACERVLAKDL
jgi:hypothetical protein